MILDAVTKSIELKLGEAIVTAQLEWILEAADLLAANASLTAVVTGDGLTNGVTAVVVLAAPAALHLRQVRLLTVYNADTIPHTVIAQLHSGANIRRYPVQTIAPGESYFYGS